MTGRLMAAFIVVFAILFGGGLYYTQIYAYYDEITPNGATDVLLAESGSGVSMPIPYEAFKAIDSESSPIRYRACFTTTLSLDELSATYEPYENASPRIAPGWFDCFDAEAIGTEIEANTARVFTSQRNIEFGIDRVVAVTEDGRGYVWHEVNECGDKAYDGTPLGDNCPERK